MALKQTPPGGGGQGRRVHWVYIPTPHGKRWHAHIAGPCHWFECHTKGKTKPCLHSMTSGELCCDRCDEINPPEVIGYQPLYREEDGRPCMVIVHEYTREAIDALKLHARVLVGRESESSAGVWVVTAPNPNPKYTSRLPERMAPADLTETLLRVWGIPELVVWYRQTQESSAPAPVPPAPKKAPKKSNGQPFSPMTEAAASKYTGPEPKTTDESLDAVFNRIATKLPNLKPSANGKHDNK